MRTVTATASRTVDAPAAVVFRCLSDFRVHRPRFLPSAFSDFRVDEGGTGDGTVVSFTVTAGGRSRPYTMRVAVTEPGRVLEERDTRSSLVTRFTVTPDGSRARVHIETTWKGAGGVGGFFERMFAPGALKRIYHDELARLDAYARDQASHP
ncbi:MAG TPA: SRPBCC family protein [Acidimicrobiales bacterium]|nr:SRPBCC family protein [Acidimicrobiales bacterium]